MSQIQGIKSSKEAYWSQVRKIHECNNQMKSAVSGDNGHEQQAQCHRTNVNAEKQCDLDQE